MTHEAVLLGRSIADYLISPQIVGPILGVIFTVLLIHLLLPFLQRKKKEAKDKLDNFYNVAYAFVKVRENFSVSINGKVHNKENCGWFHNFVDGNSNMAGPIGSEIEFFNLVSYRFYYIDQNLKDKFIEYFKCRGPESVQHKSGCENAKLIKIRKEIEAMIVEQYENYRDILGK